MRNHIFLRRLSKLVLVLLAATSFNAQQLMAASPADSPASITKLTGEVIQVQLNAIENDGTVKTADVALVLDEIRKIDFGRPVNPQPISAKFEIRLHGGGKVFGSSAVYDGNNVSVETSSGRLDISIEVIEAVRFDRQTAMLDTFNRAIQKPLEDKDQVFVKVDNVFQPVPGYLENISVGEVAVNYGNKLRKLTIDQVYGVVLARPTSATDDLKPNARVTLVDGSELSGVLAGLREGALELKLNATASLKIPEQSVSFVDIRSSKLNYLSELTPLEEKAENLLVAVDRPTQRDRSIDQNPLTLLYEQGKVSRSFEKGLGMHAGCLMTFANDTGFDRFAAIVGIDAETKRKGDCILVVFADSKEIYRERIRGLDEPKQVDLDIKGSQKITLQVEAGEGLDLGDHANWCEARFYQSTTK